MLNCIYENPDLHKELINHLLRNNERIAKFRETGDYNIYSSK